MPIQTELNNVIRYPRAGKIIDWKLPFKIEMVRENNSRVKFPF